MSSGNPTLDPARVHTVLHVAKTHLDVGFTATAEQVRRRYLEEYFPKALAVAAELEASPGPARLRWSTGSWILAEALAHGTAALADGLAEAIESGVLCWHAMPFTTHTELADHSLLEHGLSIAAELDRRFGRRTRAAKMTDVPGHTRSLVPVLAAAGVDFLHIGVNPAASAPDVPVQFRWVCGDAAVSVMYQPGSYGDVQLVGDGGVAVMVDLTGDNLGPPTAQMVRERFAELARRFPNAEVRAASLDDVADVVRTSAARLPVVESEIGDTWLHGIASDPPKVAAFRGLSRLMGSWIDRGVVRRDDPALRAASTRLLLVAEHTWGLDQKTYWPDRDHWSAEQLDAVRSSAEVAAFEASWAEQRAYLVDFCELLRSGGYVELADEADAVLARSFGRGANVVDRQEGSFPGGRSFRAGERVALGDFTVVLGSDGALTSLVDRTGREWASVDSPLGRVAERSFDAGDFERWFGTYNAATTAEDEEWARWDNTKPGLEQTDAVSRWWSPVLRSARVVGADVLVIELALDRTTDAAPPDLPGATDVPVALVDPVVMTVRALGPAEVEFELSWRRQAARWPEATWWSFAPTVGDPEGWSMRKVGLPVDPRDVVTGGATLHAVESLDHVDGVHLVPWDAPLVSGELDSLLRWNPRGGAPPAGGWHFCLHANLWGTNFAMWIDDPCRARVVLELPV